MELRTFKIPGQAHAEQLYVDFWRRDTMLRCFRFS